jgi:hypothetical protein
MEVNPDEIENDLPAFKAECSLPSHSLLSTFNELSGGGERDRTDDLLRAKQVLSQLSYTPS